MSFATELGAAARLDFADVLRSRWMVFATLVYGAIAAVFVLVGLRESSVLGFTGLGRVLFSLCHALVLLLPLLALTATTQVVNRSRDDGTLELLFSLPLRRSAYFTAVSISRYASLVVPLVGVVAVLAAVGQLLMGQAIPWSFLARTLLVSASLLLAFTGIGLLVSTLVRSSARAMLASLLAWALGIALLDFALVGLMLSWRLQPQTVLLLSALNPVEAARLALVSGAEPELSVLGPVGFYLSTRVGSGALLVLGTAWPALLGLGAWLLALRSFRRGDLV